MQEVCSELGYTDLQYAKYLTGADREPYITGDEKIWLLIDDCPYSSRRLYTCFHGPWGYHPDDCTLAVVTCVRGDDDPPVTDDPGNGKCSNKKNERTHRVIKHRTFCNAGNGSKFTKE